MAAIRKLVPLSKYNKPLLNLTKDDKAEISAIKKQIRGYQYKLQPLEDQLRVPWLDDSYKATLRGKIENIKKEINSLNLDIRNVKISRYQQQMLDYIV